MLLLVALIARGVSFEFRGKRDSDRWRRNWDRLSTAGSLLAPFLIGVALANLLHGVPIDANQEFTGSFLDLLNPYSLFAGSRWSSSASCTARRSSACGRTGSCGARDEGGRPILDRGGRRAPGLRDVDAADARSRGDPDFLPAGAVLATFAVWLAREAATVGRSR